MNKSSKDAKKEVIGRIFIVGCPRSGTTLFQSLLAEHPRIKSFPESHFFVTILPPIRVRWLGIASRDAVIKFEEFMEKIGHEELKGLLSRVPPFMRQYTHMFIKSLDMLTLKENKDIWIEKTPRHLHCIKNIEKFVSKAKFIHVLRKGEEVVASLYEVTRNYPEVWGGPCDIDDCIDRWLRDVQISFNYLKNPNHIIVRYNSLVQDSSSILKEICGFIGVEFSDKMFEEFASRKRDASIAPEPWIASAVEPVKQSNLSKFYRVFDEEQRKYIIDRISSVDLDNLKMKPGR